MITQEKLKRLFHYDPDSGIFTRLIGVGPCRKGSTVGKKNSRGYMYVMIDYKKYLLHRLAWLYAYGVFPDHEVDHRDRDAENNRLTNLRSATRKQNGENRSMQRNNKSGFRGVSKHRKAWVAQITHNSENIKLGSFGTPEEASDAYDAARQLLFTHHSRED